MKNNTYISPLYPFSAKTAYYTVRRNSYYEDPHFEYFTDKDTMFKTVSENIILLPKGWKQYDIIICDNHMCYPIRHNDSTIYYLDATTGEVIYTYPEED